ncbi:MAG: adenylyl-sulfate kinase [Reyranella sp.]
MTAPLPSSARKRLRFTTCGAVDDGKSTLIGRLLYDSGSIYDDQIEEIRRATISTDGLDFAFVVDGLKAEREQGITIDVAYRYFATAGRAFLIADAPGHEQYTRNQAAAASQSDVAVLVVSAVDGIRAQTRRHLTIAALFGIRAVIVAVNKMDAVAFGEPRFDVLAAEITALARLLGVTVAGIVPAAARAGDNVVTPSTAMPWYRGPTLLALLESCDVDREGPHEARLPVQTTGRLSGGGRVSLGTLASGTLAVGDTLCGDPTLPARVARLWRAGVAVSAAAAGDAVAIELTPELDIGRGSILMRPAEFLQPALQVRARLVWLDQAPLVAGRDYDCQIATQKVVAGVSRIEGIVDLDTALTVPGAEQVAFNEIADTLLSFAQPATVATQEPALGRFILVDRQSRRTVAAGTVTTVVRHTGDLPWQAIAVTPQARARAKLQTPLVVWFTGLSGAGKSTICDLLDRRLHALGRHTTVLDGDNLRHGLNADLGFSAADRVENMRRVANVAALMADAGLIVLVSLISPYRAERQRAREVIGAERFVEVFVDAPIEVCMARDPKGHYARAAAGSLANFTGVSSVYEPPEAPDVHVASDRMQAEEAVQLILERLDRERPTAG